MKKLLLALAMTCSVAHAEIWNGNKLLEQMNGTSLEQVGASAYVLGVLDGLIFKGVCLNSRVSVGQVFEVVKATIIAQPENRHYPAAVFIQATINNYFACDTTTKPSKAGAKT